MELVIFLIDNTSVLLVHTLDSSELPVTPICTASQVNDELPTSLTTYCLASCSRMETADLATHNVSTELLLLRLSNGLFSEKKGENSQTYVPLFIEFCSSSDSGRMIPRW